MKINRSYLCLFIVFILFRLSVANIDSTSVVRTDGPQLAFEEETFDFGTIEPGTIAEHVFKFKNIGQDTVYIKRVSSG
jgi:hypothetical protein